MTDLSAGLIVLMHKGVAHLFFPYRSAGAMPGNQLNIIIQREYLLLNRVEQGLMITTREIGSAN